MRFFPVYTQTQNPSVSSELFTVYLSTINALCASIGFNDNRDFETLHFRERCLDNTYYTRIIGSLVRSAQHEHDTTTETKISTTTLDEKGQCTTSTTGNQSSSAITSIDKQLVGKGNDSLSLNNNVDSIYVGISLNAVLQDGVKEAEMFTGLSTGEEEKRHKSDDETTPTTDDRHARNSEVPTQPRDSNASQSSSVTGNCLVLSRRRVLWDEETADYLSQWESQKGNVTVTPPPSDFFNSKQKRLDGLFALRWEPKHIPRTVAWTQDALRSGSHVLGRLESFIPWVLL